MGFRIERGRAFSGHWEFGRLGAMKIIVTGAGGFLGRNLVPYLEKRGHHVVPLSLRGNDWPDGIPHDAEAFVHLAGLAQDLKAAGTHEDHLRVNVGLTQAVFDAFARSSARKFVLVSSVKAVADAPGDAWLTEESPASPSTSYGRSKLQAERSVLAKPGSRGGVYILRPAMIHGPGNKGNLNALYRWVASGIPYPFAAFDNVRSFLSVGNFNFVVDALCCRDVPPGVYHLADDEPLSTAEVVSLMGKILGRAPRMWRVPRGVVRAMARAGDFLRLPFGRGKLSKLTDSCRVDNRKIVRALGEDLPVSSREGLLLTLRSFAAGSRR
jgi:nucleoside-diphosphate-sugar epimerase